MAEDALAPDMEKIKSELQLIRDIILDWPKELAITLLMTLVAEIAGWLVAHTPTRTGGHGTRLKIGALMSEPLRQHKCKPPLVVFEAIGNLKLDGRARVAAAVSKGLRQSAARGRGGTVMRAVAVDPKRTDFPWWSPAKR